MNVTRNTFDCFAASGRSKTRPAGIGPLGGKENMKTGIELIAEERERQISVEGWTPEHDDAHEEGELSDIGALLAIHPETHGSVAVKPWGAKLDDKVRARGETPADDIRRLKVAGALIAAEIDRLQRASAK